MISPVAHGRDSRTGPKTEAATLYRQREVRPFDRQRRDAGRERPGSASPTAGRDGIPSRSRQRIVAIM